MAASVKSGYSRASSAFSSNCANKPRDALSKVNINHFPFVTNFITVQICVSKGKFTYNWRIRWVINY